MNINFMHGGMESFVIDQGYEEFRRHQWTVNIQWFKKKTGYGNAADFFVIYMCEFIHEL
mgnify:CR=1 FL=1